MPTARRCLISCLALVFCHMTLQAQWTFSGGPEITRFLSIGSGNGFLFVGTDGAGLYRSSDDGITWQASNQGLASLYVEAVTTYGGAVLAGTRGNGVFRSNDNGVTWTQSSDGLTDMYVKCLKVVGSMVFAGTRSNGVFISYNGGGTWEARNNGMLAGGTDVGDILARGDTLFAGTVGLGVYRSRDRGAYWTNVGLSAFEVKTLAQTAGGIFAGTWGGGVSRTTDFGNSWTPVTGIPWVDIRTLSAGPQGLYAATGGRWGRGGVFLSTDNGVSWSNMTAGLPESGNVIPVAVVGSTIFAGVYDYGMFRSTDGGLNWSKSAGFGAMTVHALVNAGGVTLAGTSTGGVFRPFEWAACWEPANEGITNCYVNDFAVTPAGILVGTGGGGAFRTTNSGDLWQPVSSGLLNSYVQVFQSVGSTLFAGTKGGVFRSANNGDSWISARSGIESADVWGLAESGGVLFAGTWSSGIFRSSDNGGSWQSANNGLPAIPVHTIRNTGTFLLAGTYGAGVLRSSNGGDLWTAANTGINNLYIRSLTLDGDILYATTWGGGVFRSTDRGTSWNALNQNLSELQVWGFGVGPDQLLVGPLDRGVWTHPRTGVTSPGAGVTWTVGTQQTVLWSGSTLGSNVNLKLSTDGGSTFPVNLTSNTANDGSETVTIPDKPSTTCRLRVESASNPLLFVDNPGNFTITQPLVKVITVGSPGAGVTWTVGTLQTVSWSSQNVPGNVTIRLSTDGGSSFPVTLAASTANDGNETVTIPDKPSITCRVRVQSVSDTTVRGDNPGNFTITQPLVKVITVGSPGAGVTWTVGTLQTVSWSSQNISGNVAIKLSTDGGSSFPVTLAASTANDGNETITIPDKPSITCRVRVQSVTDTTVWGDNPGNFTITQPLVKSITVGSPGAGVTWTVGTLQTVSWSSQNISGNVAIKLSTDGGSSFPVTLAASTANDGNETVTIPDKPSITCRVRVQSVTDTTIWGDNPGNFTITQPLVKVITVGAPGAGVTWTVGTLQTVSWSSQNISGNVTIRLSTDGGSSFPVGLVANTANDGNETVTIPDNPSITCRIRVQSLSDTTVRGDSPGNFTITQPQVKVITVGSPGAGVTWMVGTLQTVSWSSQNVPENVTIRLSTDGGSTFPVSLVANTANDGNETVTIPDKPSITCRVRVQSVSDTLVRGDNPGNFTITQPLVKSITVGSPGAGVTWMVGTPQTVSWSSQNVSENVTIRLSTDGGSTFPVGLVANTANDGNETVTIPDKPSITCRVRVQSVSDTLVRGNNPGNFTIEVEKTAPTIGQPLVSGGTVGQALIVTTQITDNSGVASATLFYRKGGETSFSNVIFSGTGGTYQATLPAAAATATGIDFYVKASDINGNSGRFPGTGWLSVQVTVPGAGIPRAASQPAGSAQSAYRLISIPFQPDQTDVASILEDDLGTYANTQWRLFDLKSDQSNGEMSTSSLMTPGKAYWLIVKEGGKVIDTGPGKSVSTASPYGISLHAQWNLVGNPYNFPIPVNKLTLASGDPVVLRSYEGAWNNPVSNPVTAIEPFAGYALQVASATTLNVNGDLSTGSLPRAGLPSPMGDASVSWSAQSQPQSPRSEIMWWIGIEARCQEARDVDNVAMVVRGAERDLDSYDMPEPPVVGEYVTVRFPHPDWGQTGDVYCVDARPETESGEVWEFEARTALRGRVELEFTGLAMVPPEYRVVLMDDALRLLWDVRKHPSYQFGSDGEGHKRNFSLIVGRDEDVQKLIALKGGLPESFALLPNFPNPFNPATTILYAIPTTASVSVRVYSILGQEIAVLHDGIQEAGRWSVIFDAGGLSSGIYIVRLKAESVGGAGSFTGLQKILFVK